MPWRSLQVVAIGLLGMSCFPPALAEEIEVEIPEVQLDDSLFTGEVMAADFAEPVTCFFTRPEEAEFGCCRFLDARENRLADALKTGSVANRVAAARQLWSGHSRRHAAEILELLSGEWAAEPAATDFRLQVEASLEPDAILAELTKADGQWGIWLAYLRPGPRYVPALIEKLHDEDQRTEAMLALGRTRDPRALKPLKLLLNGDDITAGFAADALALLRLREVEPLLIQALGKDKWWLRTRVCRALAEVGTDKSIPALEALAADSATRERLKLLALDTAKRIRERQQRLAAK